MGFWISRLIALLQAAVGGGMLALAGRVLHVADATVVQLVAQYAPIAGLVGVALILGAVMIQVAVGRHRTQP
jgi:hypothetical protein